MTADDVACLRQKSAPAQLQKLRESHHRICYFLSTGLTYREISDRTGYSLNRIAVLANTPAVQEQVTRYRQAVLEPQLLQDREELKLALGLQQLRMMKDHYDSADDSDELLPLRDIRADYKAIHGNGTVVNVNVGFAARLEAACAATRKLTQLEADDV